MPSSDAIFFMSSGLRTSRRHIVYSTKGLGHTYMYVIRTHISTMQFKHACFLPII